MEQDFLPLDTEKLSFASGNVYKSVTIVGKRSNQITSRIKEELGRKLAEFAPAHDNLDEITENREQIEISKFYEAQPKPTQEGLAAFLEGKVYFRNGIDPTDTNAPELNP